MRWVHQIIEWAVVGAVVVLVAGCADDGGDAEVSAVADGAPGESVADAVETAPDAAEAGAGSDAVETGADTVDASSDSADGAGSSDAVDTASDTAVDDGRSDADPGSEADAGSEEDAVPEADVGEVPELELVPEEAPIDVPDGTQWYRDVAYDDSSELNTFDILIPESEVPTPLIVYIHGGGFTGGNKASIYNNQADALWTWLDEGVAVATINYRLLVNNDTLGVIKALQDSTYCLQFMRYYADSLNIDPTRVALFGGSAGAGTSLWIGANADMADPGADDPVERMSTRVRAVALSATQGTYDIVRWETDVFVDFGLTLELMAAAEPALLDSLASFYGLGDIDSGRVLAALESPEIIDYRQSVDMLSLLDESDPPVWIQSNGPGAMPNSIGTLYHHPNHGREIRERAQEAGVEVHARLPNIGIEDDDFPPLVDFLLDAVQ